jgi:hypothetical protein
MGNAVSTLEWAEQNFAGVALGDRRRTRRLVQAAAQIAQHPEKAFPQIFDWNQLRGFYRLCHRPEATTEALMNQHWHHTRTAMRQYPLVLILHDTTELDFSHHPAVRGAGPIGKTDQHQGFLQHNSLAVVPGPRQVLGLAYQQWHVRQPAPADERSPHRKHRPRESQLWLRGIRAAGPPAPGCCWVDVGDRGSDIYEAMCAARDVGHDFLFRVTQNRTVFTAADQSRPALVKDFARTLPSQGADAVDIPARGGRPARTATVQLAAAPVWVPAPRETPQRRGQPILAAWVIRLWEDQPPPGESEPVEWILLCSVATRTWAELTERRDWYCCRWLVEIFHLIEKSGCLEEDRRFETADRLESCAALLSVVAVRVFQLRTALQAQPEAPAEQVATALESQLVRRWLGHTQGPFTVGDFVRGVAKLGGFLGRRCDGDPGVRALWRGYQRLQDMLVGFQLQGTSPPHDQT